MSETRTILVAVDESGGTEAALSRVAAAHKDDGSTIRLFHVVGPIPPGLLEFGGADTPEAEERAEKALELAESEWFEGERNKVRPRLEAMRDQLVAAGIAADRVSGHVASSLPEDRLAHLILDEARESGCDTVVVGHKAYGWLASIFHRDVSAELQKHAGDLRIVVAE